MDQRPEPHVLEQLRFPGRYEALEKLVGTQVAQLIVAPEPETLDYLEQASAGTRAREEGLFLPIFAPSGGGKTTLAHNLTALRPSEFAPTVSHTGDVSADALKETASTALATLEANDTRTIPINIDHRESDPPNTHELAQIKRFLRDPEVGYRTALIWPETSKELSLAMADDYHQIADKSPVDIPMEVTGPARSTWQDIGIATLELVNGLSSLEALGIDPRSYDPDAFITVGAFMRRIGDDFTQRRLELLRSTRKPLRLVVVFVSSSPTAGVLTELTSSHRFGLIDGNALLDATPDSELGEWWRARRGLLIQTVVQLDARAFGLPPTPSVAALRRYGSDEVRTTLDDVGIRDRGEQSLFTTFDRSDLGKFLSGRAQATYETRGTPAASSPAAFELLSERGFGGAADKALNRSLVDALGAYVDHNGWELVDKGAEKKLDFCSLIPDNSLSLTDEVVCLEYTWRSGEFLTTANRSTIAQYILVKLRNYARKLGWAA